MPKTESSGRDKGRSECPVRKARSGEEGPAVLSPAMGSSAHCRSSIPAQKMSQVLVNDKGSWLQNANIQVQGVPARGIVDSGADISIMGGELLKKVAAVANLWKRELRKADKVPRTLTRGPFHSMGG